MNVVRSKPIDKIRGDLGLHRKNNQRAGVTTIDGLAEHAALIYELGPGRFAISLYTPVPRDIAMNTKFLSTSSALDHAIEVLELIRAEKHAAEGRQRDQRDPTWGIF